MASISRAESLNEDDLPPRKRMRKGTHSCLECKRRKVRCTPSESGSVCVECAVRRCPCVSQEHEGEGGPEQLHGRRKNVRDRLGRLEAMVEELLHKIEPHSPNAHERQRSATQMPEGVSFGLQTPSTTPSQSSIEFAGSEAAPLLSLFDEALPSRKQDDSNHPSVPREEFEAEEPSALGFDFPPETSRQKYEGIYQALLSVFPSQRAMASIFDAGGSWWEVWRVFCPFVCSDEGQVSLPQFAASAIQRRHPVLAATALLCVAISVQQLPRGYDYDGLKLPVPAESLLQHYLSTVQRLVTSDDELVSSLDGLDCLIVQSKCHINLGQPRKAWLNMRRATALAQYMGLHRNNHLPKDRFGLSLMRRQRGVWWTIYTCDRFSSLLLGMPYSVSNAHIEFFDREDPDVQNPELEARYWLRLAIISGHITDLNHSPRAGSLTATYEIDQELEDLAKSMPAEWWAVASHDRPGLFSGQGPWGDFKRSMGQFSYHHLKAIIYIPFTIRAVSDPAYEHCKVRCLGSAREVIRRYQTLRDEAGMGSYICRVIDFQAFTATVLLLLNLLGYSNASVAQDPRQMETDWRMVDGMIDAMRRTTLEPCSVVVRQALKVLEALQARRERGSDLREGESVTLVIPYFGTITIGPGSQVKSIRKNSVLAGETISISEKVADVDPRHATTATVPYSPPDNPSPERLVVEPTISFNSLLGPVPPAPGHVSWPSSQNLDDGALQAPFDFDLDHEWDWIVQGGQIP